jgi:hypothetical protein
LRRHRASGRPNSTKPLSLKHISNLCRKPEVRIRASCAHQLHFRSARREQRKLTLSPPTRKAFYLPQPHATCRHFDPTHSIFRL